MRMLPGSPWPWTYSHLEKTSGIALQSMMSACWNAAQIASALHCSTSVWERVSNMIDSGCKQKFLNVLDNPQQIHKVGYYHVIRGFALDSHHFRWHYHRKIIMHSLEDYGKQSYIIYNCSEVSWKLDQVTYSTVVFPVYSWSWALST